MTNEPMRKRFRMDSSEPAAVVGDKTSSSLSAVYAAAIQKILSDAGEETAQGRRGIAARGANAVYEAAAVLAERAAAALKEVAEVLGFSEDSIDAGEARGEPFSQKKQIKKNGRVTIAAMPDVVMERLFWLLDGPACCGDVLCGAWTRTKEKPEMEFVFSRRTFPCSGSLRALAFTSSRFAKLLRHSYINTLHLDWRFRPAASAEFYTDAVRGALERFQNISRISFYCFDQIDLRLLQQEQSWEVQNGVLYPFSSSPPYADATAKPALLAAISARSSLDVELTSACRESSSSRGRDTGISFTPLEQPTCHRRPGGTVRIDSIVNETFVDIGIPSVRILKLLPPVLTVKMHSVSLFVSAMQSCCDVDISSWKTLSLSMDWRGQEDRLWMSTEPLQTQFKRLTGVQTLVLSDISAKCDEIQPSLFTSLTVMPNLTKLGLIICMNDDKDGDEERRDIIDLVPQTVRVVAVQASPTLFLVNEEPFISGDETVELLTARVVGGCRGWIETESDIDSFDVHCGFLGEACPDRDHPPHTVVFKRTTMEE